MTRSLPILLIAAASAFAVTPPSVDSLDWLIDNSYDERAFDITVPAVTMPEEIAFALQKYRAGEFRVAAVTLDKVRQLSLPDGLLDFTCFALAESYRMLDVDDLARDNYHYVCERFPRSDKRAPSLFRLVQYAYEQRATAFADSVLAEFRGALRSHPLASAVHYEVGKLYYRLGRFSESIDVLSAIARSSSQHAQAQFLAGLGHVQLKQWDKALLVLDYARKRTNSPDLAAEASIVIGDIYYAQGTVQTALQFYSLVPRNALRAVYANVKTARCHLDLKAYEKAREIASDYLRKHPSGQFAFEMMSVLEQAYSALGDKEKAQVVGKLIYRQVVNARLSLDIYQELNSVSEMVARWRRIELEGMRSRSKQITKAAHENIMRLHSLEGEFWNLLGTIRPVDTTGAPSTVSGLEVYRYLTGLRNRLMTLSDSIVSAEAELAKPGALRDSTFRADSSRLTAAIQAARRKHSLLEREYDMIAREHASGSTDRLKKDEETPAKFVDWSFMKYLDRKRELAQAARKSSTPADTARSSAAARVFSLAQREKMIQSVAADRDMLKKHISTMLEYYPRSRFNPQILFRLAELKYDEASDVFEQKLRAYEARLAEGRDTAGMEFPDYDLGEVLGIYDTIIAQYPNDALADDALFYKALAFQKEGDYEAANLVLLELTKSHPESEFYVEANMLVGRYYFEHPKAHGGTGYKLAEEAFREVLYFRDHPQFVQALYSLGWCYYMQDQYREAIAVFKYLVEEVELNFDPSKVDEQQVVNPLLRGEAIDYIAVSFDEGNRLNDAVAFLGLIGNTDYSALVLKRIGELREEIQDYPAALEVYERLLKEYPTSTPAPEAAASIIKIHDVTGKGDLSVASREEFFATYGRTSEYWRSVATRDSSLLPRIDSMAVANGLFVADRAYRAAEASGSLDGYRTAAERYATVVKTYPDHARAVEARWNLALIRDQKLNEPEKSYRDYIAYSRSTVADSAKREQAAMNAIVIAQKLLLPDSLTKEGALDPSSTALIDAVNNYIAHFSSSGNISDVLLSLGAVYFNRKMFSNANKIYRQILDRGERDRNYHKALFLAGQCHFGEDDWDSASVAFERVYKKASDQHMRESAQKLLIQSEYLKAKRFFSAQDYGKAAAALTAVEDRFPQSGYGDVVLFSAAEAFEKLEKWAEAAKSYHRLVDAYPRSKYAADALFNEASAHEKAKDFAKAAEAYELLVSNYPESNKAKDALFNVGFCYEKLGKPDKVAEANVRYTSKYPEEKDARAMFLRSAQFYFKTEMYEKSKNVYQNFLRRFANDPSSVEALYMIGKIHLASGSGQDAIMLFEHAERQHKSLLEGGKEGNAYFASEAAFGIAEVRRKEFDNIRFDRAGKGLKEDQENKTRRLVDAIKAYTRVVQYQSEKMFEAAFRIGDMYEQYARAWLGQKRENMDATKTALFERDLFDAASVLLQKSLVPYRKVLELQRGFDSLKAEQRKWIDTTRHNLETVYLEAGDLLVNSVGVVYAAPIPKEIESQPVYYFQYLKQLNETLEPLKIKARSFFLGAQKEMTQAGLTIGAGKCLERFSKLNFLIGNDYEKLAEKILKKEYPAPKVLSDDDREEMEFQLEDLLFEMQDKAIFSYEDALRIAETEKIQDSKWSRSILEGLARLSPETYGKSFYQIVSFASDQRWPVRTDSISGWSGPQASVEGWEPAEIISDSLSISFSGSMPKTVWSPDVGASRFYMRKDVHLAGLPRDAALHYAIGGKFRLFVNGTLVVSDTIGQRAWTRIDSLTKIGSLFRGGDNVIALEVTKADTVLPGVTVVFSAMIDTSQHFPSTVAVPSFASASDGKQAGPAVPAGSSRSASPDASRDAKTQSSAVGAEWTAAARKSRGEVIESITDYDKRNQETGIAIRRERLEIQKLRIKQEYLDAQLEALREEVGKLRKPTVPKR